MLMALFAVSSRVSPAEVEEEFQFDKNDCFRTSCIFGHDPAGIHRGGRSTAKREISIGWPLNPKQCLSRARFAVKWITNDFINLKKEDLPSSFIVQC